MTIRAPAIDCADARGGWLRTTVTTSNSSAVMKDRVSDSQTYESGCLSVRYFIPVNYRKQMYLFISQQSVYMKGHVSVTEKTRHSGAPWSHYRNSEKLDTLAVAAYKHDEKAW